MPRKKEVEMSIRVSLLAFLIPAISLLTTSVASAQRRSVPYAASNFTANGAMTWTVDEADVKTFRYMINDRTMTVAVFIETSTVSGTADQYLLIKIPAGHKSGSLMANQIFLRRDSGAPFNEHAFAFTTPGGTSYRS